MRIVGHEEMVCPRSGKICIVGEKSIRDKVVKSLVGGIETWQSDSGGTVYKLNVPITVGEFSLFVWDINVLDGLAAQACRVAVIMADENLNANMNFFRERWPSCQFVIHVDGKRLSRRDLLQNILSIIHTDLIVVERKEGLLVRLTKLQEELASIIAEIRET